MSAPLALFDLDNTLVDREAAFARWARDFATTHGDESLTDQIITLDGDGLTSRVTLVEWLRESFALTSSVDHLLADYHDTYPTYFELPASSAQALRSLRDAGWKVGVVTNGPPSQLRKLEVTGLNALVDAVCVSGIVGSNKPDPAIFFEAAHQCGSSLENGWMVGDSVDADIAGGLGCGLSTVWMSRGRTWPDRSFTPHYVARDIPDAVSRVVAGHDA